jgi:glycosyltransferase involved in cell wall biosynthesis
LRITLINQAFYPDVVSSGQHLTDLARGLAERGHAVTVITSRRAYDDPAKTFPGREDWHGIKIYRVFNTGFGKRAKWRRAADFLSFLLACCWRLIFIPKPEVVVALTSPPLVSVIAAGYARLRRTKFCYWIMDLNPDEAVAAGWLAPDSFAARWLERLSRFSLNQATTVVVLDEFMQKRILAKGVASEKIAVIPPWSHDAEVRFDPAARARFRQTHGLDGKFVVMYAGNHSPCHPLATVLAAARELAGSHADISFCFVGGGSEHGRVKSFAQEHRLANVLCLPYQPLAQLAGVLSAADLQLVVMGDPFVGLVHPCKAYNLLRVHAPILYVGPKPSHISQILDQISGQLPTGWAPHGNPAQTVSAILELKQRILLKSESRKAESGNGSVPLDELFSQDTLLPRMVALIETNAQKELPIRGQRSEASVRRSGSDTAQDDRTSRAEDGGRKTVKQMLKC